MAGFSTVTLIGRLGRAPEIKKLQNGRKLALLTVGCREVVPTENGLRQRSQWHQVVVTASDFVDKVIEKTYRTGSYVQVTGPLVYRHREIRDSAGKTHYVRYAQVLVTEYGRIRNIPRAAADAIDLAEYADLVKLRRRADRAEERAERKRPNPPETAAAGGNPPKPPPPPPAKPPKRNISLDDAPLPGDDKEFNFDVVDAD